MNRKTKGAPLVKLDHLVILVSDLSASLPFYEKLLSLIGFSKGRNHVFGNSDGLYIDLQQAKRADHPYQRYAPGLNHMGFTAPNLDDVLEVQRRMREAGFEVAELQKFDSETALFLKDPDGMRVEVTHYG